MSALHKYAFPGGVEHVSGGYMLPADEPLYVLRGKDAAAPETVRAYAAIAERLAETAPPEARAVLLEHAASSRECAAELEAWQARHPRRVGAGCTTHPVRA